MSLNPTLAAIARKMLKENLAKCDDKQQEIFKLMYGRDGGKRSVDEAKAMPINDVVDQMPDDKISWALTQVERTVDNNQARATESNQQTPIQ